MVSKKEEVNIGILVGVTLRPLQLRTMCCATQLRQKGRGS